MPTSPQFERAYASLNPEQRRAVDLIDGPVMVIAGPGTGKTQVLSLRVGNILKKTDVSPGNILCLTFTDAAAVNMRERLSELIGSAGYKVAVHTFHSFARDIITTHPEYFYGGADFIAADELAQLSIFESIFSDLPRTDPLSASLDGEFTYLQDARRAIGLLKQAGIGPEEFADIIEGNAKDLSLLNTRLGAIFDERMGKSALKKIAALVDELSPRGGYAEAVAVSLGRALKAAYESEKIAPVSAWKEQWTRKDDSGSRVHKDALYLEKMRSLARVYRDYRERMRKERYYDFDDMLLDVVEALRKYPPLLSSLQERYHYILVDEFQDTNDAQLTLVRLLGSAPVNEGKPNVMVVGDDDQAIYRFQGAEVSNILDFPKPYASHELVVLTKNYRSTQEILDVAREVIEKSEERLAKVLPAFEKKLTAERKELRGHIKHIVLSTRAHEHAYIAREIAKLICDGRDPSGIAVIARRHKELEDIARVLVSANIPIIYERKQNVFEEEHIRLLLDISRFVDSVLRSRAAEADEYLPRILSAPVWGISREDIWRVSVAASRRDDRTWLGAMEEDKNEKIREIAAWLMELAVRAPNEPLERILDEILGTEGVLLPVDEDDAHEEAASPYPRETRVRNSTAWKSPIREYYFGKDARKRAEARYLLFLSSLRVFVGALREYKRGSLLTIHDLVEFADMHERNRIPLADTTPFASATKAVNLLTAHKAKGLEFDTVFVASCQEDVWCPRGYPNKLPMPMNLRHIQREDGGDDRLRVFYVALTRAKRELWITAYRYDDAGKPSLRVGFIAPENESGHLAKYLKGEDAQVAEADLVRGLEVLPKHPEFFPIIPGERAILLELLRDYRMSVTHLNNFLNVAEGGPAAFLEQNLLCFPQAMRPASAYGDAMHKAIERYFREWKRIGKVPSCEILLEYFREIMGRERLPESERLHFLHAGEEALPIWYERSGRHIPPSLRFETDFKHQGVVVLGVPVTGKIDKMILDESNKTAHVTDFKTGKAKSNWKGRDKNEKILLRGYQRQLLFYKLLVERSHDFSGYRVEKGTLEFLEPVGGDIATLELQISEEETRRLEKLISAVHKRILSLDFPDTDKYSKDIDGIIAFEEDLLAGDVTQQT